MVGIVKMIIPIITLAISLSLILIIDLIIISRIIILKNNNQDTLKSLSPRVIKDITSDSIINQSFIDKG